MLWSRVKFVCLCSLLNHMPTYISKYTSCAHFFPHFYNSPRQEVDYCALLWTWQRKHSNINNNTSEYMRPVRVYAVSPGSILPEHSCHVSVGRFGAAERQSVTLQYLWAIFRRVVLSALHCTRQSAYPGLHNLQCVCDNKQLSVDSSLLSKGKSRFPLILAGSCPVLKGSNSWFTGIQVQQRKQWPQR